MSAAKRGYNVEEVLELHALDFDWIESEASDVEKEIDYQTIWEP